MQVEGATDEARIPSRCSPSCSPRGVAFTRTSSSSSSASFSSLFSSLPSISADNSPKKHFDDTVLTALKVAKKTLSMERMSPSSVDSGFDSSFPSSPDSSVDLLLTANTPSFSVKTSRADASAVSVDIPPFTPTIDTGVNCHCSSPLPCLSPEALPSSSTSSSHPSDDSLLSPSTSSPSSPNRLGSNHLNSTKKLIGQVHEKVSDLTRPKDEPDEPAHSESSCTLFEDRSLVKLKSEVFSECPSTPSSSSCCVAVPSSSHHQRESFRVRCHWDGCAQRFGNDNDLYDHVMKGHLEVLRPPECVSPTSKGRSSPKTRSRNLSCKWDDCKMCMSRGDTKKQFLWLEDHFTTRHAGKAQPYACLIEGCTSRFTMKRALEDHLRTGHEKAKGKRAHSEEDALSKPKSCFQWTPIPYFPPDPRYDFVDTSTEEWLVMRLREYERTKLPCFVSRPPSTPRGGAAYRKRRRILTFAIQPLSQKEKVKCMDTMSAEERSRLLLNAFVSRKGTPSSTTRSESAKPNENNSSL